MENRSRFKYLLSQYFQNKCTSEEVAELAQMINVVNDDKLSDLLEWAWIHHSGKEKLTEEESEEILSSILNKDKKNEPPKNRVRFLNRRWLGHAAAIFLLLIAVGSIVYYTVSFRGSEFKNNRVSKSNDITPGTEGAILTLANGQSIILDSLNTQNKRLLTTQNGTKILLKNQQVIYNVAQNAALTKAYNSLSTPKGRMFKLQLPDGTRVWLNAASSIRYPVAFDENERQVTIRGEAYFEVAKIMRKDGNGRVPFIVNIETANPNADAKVEVLGTHFNISAYTDEAFIKTTLLEGSVKVYQPQSATATKIIPGSQAIMSSIGKGKIEVRSVDVNDAVAWKNGFFNFDQVSLHDVMQELSRWYNVDIVYKGNVPNRIFWGKMQRSLYLSQVLNALAKVDVHFKIQQNKIIVMP